MNTIKAALTIALFGLTISVQAQNKYSTGAIFNPATVAKTPRKVELSFRSFKSLPTSYSLEKYCPTPGNQGNHGTCVAFANGYGVATILYAQTHDLTDKALIDKYAFSPTYLYEQIKDASDVDCQNGSDPINALVTMIKGGDALFSTVPYQCGATLTDVAKAEAVNYKIQDAAILFASTDMMGDSKYEKTTAEKIELTKKAISEGTPVSTGFFLPETFFHITSDVWYTKPEDTLSDWKHSGHAMAIVGYDDNKAGGAFRVLNSWGTDWADHGYVWIRYNDYAQWCAMALQVYADPYTREPAEKHHVDPTPTPQPDPKPDPKPKPEPKPAPQPENNVALGGSVEFRLNDGSNMEVNKISTRNLVVDEDIPDTDKKEDLVAYRMNETYTSGTKFRFYINAEQEAYIYAFASDLTGKVNLILPFDDLISTHIGANSIVAFPSDKKIIKMDDQKGTDYLLILYSREKLDAADIAASMNSMKGSFSKKIKSALGNKLINTDKIKYDATKPGFSVAGNGSRNLNVADDNDNTTSGGTVVPIMVELSHN
ncbi:C1 family peptidase [Limnovirga soli]|uniref:DUF4384 domain-containing protein n=1 Tax=Limnovirga soli TaxID=2656915 RepID=A0A8J8JSU7_9BACT|nr:C1 family peptidase [Limnovirga soli]NNV53974.1 DUF4384 domain-containing protein [Limnovirga soli]